jgi:uncharacterized membrane protein (Fun14 family)
MNVEHLAPLATSIGFGGMAGFLIGFAIKKVMKILAVVAGAFFTALIYLESQNIISINWDKLQTTSQGALTTLTNAVNVIPVLSTTSTNLAIPLTGSMAMGFAVGFMKG